MYTGIFQMSGEWWIIVDWKKNKQTEMESTDVFFFQFISWLMLVLLQQIYNAVTVQTFLYLSSVNFCTNLFYLNNAKSS